MSSKKSSPPPAPAPVQAQVPTAAEIAQQQVQAAIQARPQAAQAEFDIFTGPTGLGATTAEFERVRKEQFPEETKVREQLLSNILGNLISPTGVTPEQQQAVDQRRGTAQSELQTALRERANLGGGLFGGRAGRTEERAVSDLQARFAEEDINREETARLNALNAALPALQLLFPDIGLTQNQFINPVPSAEASLASSLQGRGQDITQRGQDITIRNQDIGLQQAELARQSALQSALFGAVGTAAGGALGGPLGASLGGSLGKKAGGLTTGTSGIGAGVGANF